jgi:hypothetical protein
VIQSKAPSLQTPVLDVNHLAVRLKSHRRLVKTSWQGPTRRNYLWARGRTAARFTAWCKNHTAGRSPGSQMSLMPPVRRACDSIGGVVLAVSRHWLPEFILTVMCSPWHSIGGEDSIAGPHKTLPSQGSRPHGCQNHSLEQKSCSMLLSRLSDVFDSS